MKPNIKNEYNKELKIKTQNCFFEREKLKRATKLTNNKIETSGKDFNYFKFTIAAIRNLRCDFRDHC